MTMSTTSSVRLPVRRSLRSDWSLIAVAGPVADGIRGAVIPATVPGCVHTDLLAAGLIPDPYLDDNEALLKWIGLTDWRYTTTFSWQQDDADHTDLVFDGLDTIAAVTLNGSLLGETRNMHRTYRFSVHQLLRPGLNELTVEFSSPIKYADAASLAIGYRPHTNHHPYNAIRKMASSFGWDWGIDTATSGMWRPVTLESWSTARLATVRPVATVETVPLGAAPVGIVDVHVDVARADLAADLVLRVAATVSGVTASVDLAAGETTAVVSLRVPGIDLWWPRGYGEQPLYQVDVTVDAVEHPEDGAKGALEGTRLDATSRTIGFRTVRFNTTPDESGTPFTIEINGQPVFVRGANWITDDAFPHRVDRARYRRRLEQAEFANINLLRVWGGGIYESDDFYELCDEKGILTWQDFLFACAAYAEEEPLRSEVLAEVRDNVTRLASHPSLVVFNGNNENIWGYGEWKWAPRLQGKTWGSGYYYDLIPAIVAELAPQVGYTPGSPFSPAPLEAGLLGSAEPDALGAVVHAPNDPDHGTMHIWDLWNQRDYPHYRDYAPRFVSEFGWQGPPTWSTMTSSINDAPLTPESPGMLVHQKASEGNTKLTDGLVAHLPLPNEIGDWHWAMSLNQAIAVTTAIEYFRSLEPHCMGSIVWQLNDCWPVTSWAAVDGYERPKPLLYALRHAYADRIVTIQPQTQMASPSQSQSGAAVLADPLSAGTTLASAPTLAVTAVNDSPNEWSGNLVARRLDFTGTTLASYTESVTIPARSTVTVQLPADIGGAADVASELVRADLGGVHGDWFFAEYRDSALVTADLDGVLATTPTGYTLQVTARSLTRDLALLVDKLDADARVSDALVTLLPGESTVFEITTETELDLAALTGRTILRSANQLLER
jgi:beta-mannosidase